jgi:hypothetical protein
VKNSTSRLIRAHRRLPAIVAVGSSLAALPAAALELGELTVHSGLGQPLRASIAYVLAPNEQLASNCVSLRRGASASGVPSLGAATISVSKGVISLTGRTPVLEPMAAAHIVVNCPFTPKISREYLTFVDPASVVVYQQAEVTQPSIPVADPVANPVANTIAVQATAAATVSPVQQDIGVSTQYLVQIGDSVSSIVLRISDRTVALWPAVNAIVEVNPDAFVDNDPNQLMAGSWINIPAFDGSASLVANVQASVVEPYVVEATVVESTVVEATVVEATVFEPTVVDEVIVDAEMSAENTQAYEPEAAAYNGVTTGDLLPGDIVLDAQIERPATTSAPVEASVIITPTANGGGTAPNWLVWLAGGAIASIFGLFMFRRRFRGDNAPVEPEANLPNRPRYEDSQTAETANVESLGVDLDLTDNSPTEENLTLDADLISGTGLDDNSSADISQDFGFAATTELDIELPFERITAQPEKTDKTDIMPPMRIDAESILDDEVMPEEEDDYDMSVIVDATKIPQPEDVTERDLKAVEVAIDDETMIAENYSINKEVDFEAVEQDYEDEMTATQALNEEIARAATNIALGLDDSDDNDATARSPTLTGIEELEVTAQMPAQNDDHSNLDETGINEAITVVTPTDEDTVEMPAKSGKSS